jgi:hypothetical protein
LTKRFTLVRKAADLSKALPISHDDNPAIALADRLEVALNRIDTALAVRKTEAAAAAARHAALKSAAAEAVAALDAIVGTH